jgi:hypothetical protein
MNALFFDFLFCALRCVASQQAKNGLTGSSCARACGARKVLFEEPLRHDFAALDSPWTSSGSSRAERLSRALTLVSLTEAREGS